MKAFTVGQVAKRAGVGIETVRFYERHGLLDEPVVIGMKKENVIGTEKENAWG